MNSVLYITRIWNKKKKKYIGTHDLIKGFPMQGDFDYYHYTGMCDCNGTRVFQGDILRSPDTKKDYIIDYHYGMAMFVGIGEDGNYELHRLLGNLCFVNGNINNVNPKNRIYCSPCDCEELFGWNIHVENFKNQEL